MPSEETLLNFAPLILLVIAIVGVVLGAYLAGKIKIFRG